MRLTVLGPVPDNLLAVFYDPTKIGSEEQKECRGTNMCRLLGFGSCPAEFLRTEKAISLAVEELDNGETRPVTLIGGSTGPRVAEYLPHFIGTFHKTGVGRELCDFAIEQHGRENGGSIDSGPDPQAP
jgi:hypothetical protein